MNLLHRVLDKNQFIKYAFRIIFIYDQQSVGGYGTVSYTHLTLPTKRIV